MNQRAAVCCETGQMDRFLEEDELMARFIVHFYLIVPPCELFPGAARVPLHILGLQPWFSTCTQTVILMQQLNTMQASACQLVSRRHGGSYATKPSMKQP